ncbi:multipass membrane protein [Cuniculiplasma divulgatum]|uniref:Multipass membrane protein n=1 Tax=Cuniculiplasma divulgatum TaxID=1673428 RepID=A0A1N5W2E4_9ARCH|nr:multipass membrane protein [Cuniculiplasma divulgatum]
MFILTASGFFGPFSPGTGIGFYILPPVLILLAITLSMTLPITKRVKWSTYRRPLYVTAVLFENWISVVGLVLILVAPPGVGTESKAIYFLLTIIIFWAATIVLASKRIQSRFIPEMGLFRPDLLYPTGANLARGEIFAGLGLKLMLTITPVSIHNFAWLPVWNWWGLLWAELSMVFLVAVRGMTKLKVVLMGRMIKQKMLGWRGTLLEEGFLYLGFTGLSYGFLNVFMGYIPFTVVYPRFWPGALIMVIAAIILIPVRGYLKHKVDRITMSYRRTLGLMALLYLGVMVLMYGMIVMLMGRFLVVTTTLGLVLGLFLQILGISVIVFGRARSIMNDRKGMLPQMLWVLSHADEQDRQRVMKTRLEIFASMNEKERYVNMKNMYDALMQLPDENQSKMLGTQMMALSYLESEKRGRCMRTMDRITSMGVSQE